MNVTWIFQKAGFADDAVVQKLIYAVQEYGDEVRIETYRPFGEMRYEQLPNNPVITIGSIAFIKDAQRKIQNAPGAWAPWEKLRCSYYYPRYMQHIAQHRWTMMPWGALPAVKDFLFDHYGGPFGKGAAVADPCLFFRPNENTKRFVGQVVTKDKFDEWYKWTDHDCEIDDLIIVSQPVVLEREWRLVVCRGSVATATQYFEDGYLSCERDCPSEVITFAESVAKDWTPDNLFVMDIGEVVNHGLKVVEIGSFNCAGLYACNPRVVVAVAHSTAESDWKEENKI